jgi:hypothetical protein
MHEGIRGSGDKMTAGRGHPGPAVLAVKQSRVLVVNCIVAHSTGGNATPMPASTGAVLRQARTVRGPSVVDAARAAAISPAYLSRLENNAVKNPSRYGCTSSARRLPYPTRS